MKTVIDAVNEFKGEIDTGCIAFVCNQSSGSINGWYNDTFVDLATPQWTPLCCAKEFNDLVSQMETNFGRWSEIAIQAWKDGDKVLLTKSTKEVEVMDIEWSKAPEGATHYGPKNGTYVDGWYKVSDGCTYFCRPHNNVWFKTIADRPISQLITNTQPTLTYTQAMADNGELPSVGMKFIYCDSTNTKNNAIVTYASEWNIVFKCLDDGFSKDVELAKEISGLDIIRQILPLTPPVELIDGKAYQFDYSHHADYYNIQGVYNEEELAFFSARDVLLAEYCTNIQPLTVEVK